MTIVLMSSTRPLTRKLASSKRAPLETIQLYLQTFLATRNSNDVNLDGNVWWLCTNDLILHHDSLLTTADRVWALLNSEI